MFGFLLESAILCSISMTAVGTMPTVHRQKILENKQRNEERKARTRRLIERGAVLEGIFPLAPDLPGVEVKAFLIALSHLPGAAELTANLPKSGDTP